MKVSHVYDCTSQSYRQALSSGCSECDPRAHPLLLVDSSRVNIGISSSREPPLVFQPRLDLGTVDSDDRLPSGEGKADSM